MGNMTTKKEVISQYLKTGKLYISSAEKRSIGEIIPEVFCHGIESELVNQPVVVRREVSREEYFQWAGPLGCYTGEDGGYNFHYEVSID